MSPNKLDPKRPSTNYRPHLWHGCLPWAGTALLLITACTQGGPVADADGAGGKGGDQEAPPALNEIPDLPKSCRTVETAPLRRLSHIEWAASVRDLFAEGEADTDKAVSFDELPKTWEALTPDPDASGFRNRADRLNPTELLISDYAEAARAVAAQVMTGPRTFLPCAQTDMECAETFIDGFGKKVFRRPLDAEEKQRFSRFFVSQTSKGFDVAVQLTLELFLQSPQFLYRVEGSEVEKQIDPFATASRLSYLLWSSIPDEALLTAAAAGELDSGEGRAKQAMRMINDPRFRFMATAFHDQWLAFDRVWQEDKRDETFYPSVPDNLRELFVKEARLFVDWVMKEHGGDPGVLLSSRVSFVDETLAEFYGVEPPQTPWGEVTLPEAQRAGYLTRGLFNWSFAHSRTSSPPLRGSFVIKRVLCAEVPEVPPGANTTPPDPDPSATTRELFEANASPAACRSCHKMLDGIGFAFENYDATGAYRDQENDKAVDSSGNIDVGSDVDGDFEDGLAFNLKLANSNTVRECASAKWLAYALGRALANEEGCIADWMADALSVAKGDVGAMLVAWVRQPAFVAR